MPARTGIALCLAIAAGGCASFQSLTPAAPGVTSPATFDVRARTATAALTVLHVFGGGTDGKGVTGPLVVLHGVLYGTTVQGGRARCKCGTVFGITPSGDERVIHSFQGGLDGAFPGGLVVYRGALYGVTSRAGGDGGGTVFRLAPNGEKRTLYSFPDAPRDGVFPQALYVGGGQLYGTTSGGGRLGHGTFFALTPAGGERSLYDVPPYQSVPQLVWSDGTFYGSKTVGCAGCESGTGVLLSLSASGAEQDVADFDEGTYGSPQGPPVPYDGDLYVASSQGGNSTCTWSGALGPWGCGVIYKLQLPGTITAAYAFDPNPDGVAPNAAPAVMHARLYGTTWGGGTGSCSDGGYATTGCGTIYELSASGRERVLYSFANASDGGRPSQLTAYGNV
ncbi:MAG TPA: choice-of-anchor tandem repeat GloVer-containing protein, partial [Candidatus Acidoferrales bacterium]|nr:choice-of-anchor tandem repeat GloVer-containing protein [Candidatus Acidoferrales bacterium]